MSLKRRQSRKLGSRRKLEEHCTSSEGLQKRDGTVSETKERESEGGWAVLRETSSTCVPQDSKQRKSLASRGLMEQGEGSPVMLELNVGGAETSGVQPPLALQLDREGGAIKTPAWWHRLWDTAGQETAENGSGRGEWRMEESQPKGGVEERGEGVEEEEVTKS